VWCLFKVCYSIIIYKMNSIQYTAQNIIFYVKSVKYNLMHYVKIRIIQFCTIAVWNFSTKY
jgi:hypothetical protein